MKKVLKWLIMIPVFIFLIISLPEIFALISVCAVLIVAYIPYLIALGIIAYLVYYFTHKKSD